MLEKQQLTLGGGEDLDKEEINYYIKVIGHKGQMFLVLLNQLGLHIEEN